MKENISEKIPVVSSSSRGVLAIPEIINEASGIKIFGKLIKSFDIYYRCIHYKEY